MSDTEETSNLISSEHDDQLEAVISTKSNNSPQNHRKSRKNYQTKKLNSSWSALGK